MSDIHEELGLAVLRGVDEMFRAQKRMADSAIRQITFEQMLIEPDPESNSVVVLMKHLSHAMRSRWADFLTTDGEKPWRDREEEFTDRYTNRAEVEHDWEDGWDTLFKSLAKLGPVDLTANITIRDETEIVIGVIYRQLSHYAYHIGQITVLCRTLAGAKWSTLTVPRRKTK